MDNQTAIVLTSNTEDNNERDVLYEAKSFRQTRERTFLQWPLHPYPCRLKMKEAGWFIVRTEDGKLIAVCLYCKKGCTGWNYRHDPYKVHKYLSPNCDFVSFPCTIQTPPSPIVESVPRREQVRPSSHPMAILPERVNSFNQWPPASFHPSFDILAEAGLFYNGNHTIVECFSCQGQLTIVGVNNDPMTAHIHGCKYARHLRDQPQRAPLQIQASHKVYKIVEKRVNNVMFYFLQCISASIPLILLSVRIVLPNGQELVTSDRNIKRLRPSNQLQQKVNWVTSSDGPLVNICKELAQNPVDLNAITDNSIYSTEGFSSSNINNTVNPSFQCKTCLTDQASPHIVSMKCCHFGVCFKQCFFKWMTCVTCGYTLGKAIRIYGA
ncbi:unnamed protein product [Rotaria sordida]|uniref:RING-type domain-containing protein n=2 Tax=Rotaria sordida TaxID=392033 RepID=A0A814LVI7_9BILA|nr:unnamed protein product [Rotaria sordida]CAF1129815.1 unnamed protein product [Rotaria sordida]CAF3826957.1 unnamed protein product [Rotaria sordida]